MNPHTARSGTSRLKSAIPLGRDYVTAEYDRVASFLQLSAAVASSSAYLAEQMLDAAALRELLSKKW
jgi:hypothetical protein